MKTLLMTTLVALMTSPILAANPAFVPYGPSTNYGRSSSDNHGISDWTFKTGNLGRYNDSRWTSNYDRYDSRGYGSVYGAGSRWTNGDGCRNDWSQSLPNSYHSASRYRDYDGWKYGSVNTGWNGGDVRYQNQVPSSSWKQPYSHGSYDTWNNRPWNY